MYWINIFIQFFQHNNKIVNDQVQKKSDQLFEQVCDIPLHHACA